MSKIIALNANKTSSLDQATEWVVKLDRGLNDGEQAALKTWLGESRDNLETFLKLAKLWDKMDSLSKLSELFPHTPDTAKKKPYFGIAASFAFVSLLALGLFMGVVGELSLFPQHQVIQSKHMYTTAVGEQATFYLEDNTKLELNTNSLVNVTYTDKQRLIELLRGELHVDVAHNREQPLSVYANDNVIQAVGTAFNVKLQDSGVELIVTDGKVLVEDIIDLPNEPLALKNVHLKPSSFAVSKGQKAQLAVNNSKIVDTNSKHYVSELAWHQGNLIFRGESLSEAMLEVARYTNYTFSFSNDEIKQQQIAGLFKISDIDGFLLALEDNFDIEVTKQIDNRVILSSKTLSAPTQ